MEDGLDPAITESERNVEQALQEYYESQLDELTETDAYKEAELEFKNMEQRAVDKHKREIDKAMSGIN